MRNAPILEQLKFEEALLRSEAGNFCIINQGSSPAIVMGISGKPEEHLNISKVKKDQIPVIKRFSGGGTVIVDADTLFVSYIIEKKDLDIHPFPEPILRWTAELYNASWQIPDFKLTENDYCIGEKKCGGNAQYIQKSRWLHHTTFLWDYSEKNMSYLKLPKKRPKYREDRSHADFLTKLKSYAPDPNHLVTSLLSTLGRQFEIVDFDLKSWREKPHRKSTSLLEI